MAAILRAVSVYPPARSDIAPEIKNIKVDATGAADAQDCDLVGLQ